MIEGQCRLALGIGVQQHAVCGGDDAHRRILPAQHLQFRSDGGGEEWFAEVQVEQLPQAEIDSGKVWAILGYIIPILCIVPFVQKDNRFALFHAKQQLVVIIVMVALSVLSIIPFVGCVIAPLSLVAGLVFLIMGLINAINGRMKPLPLIGTFAIDWFKGMQATPRA